VVAFALATCAGGFLNAQRAWRLGYRGEAIPYLGCQVVGFFLSVLAAGAVATAFEHALGKGAASISNLKSLFVALVVLGCAGPIGLPAAWPVAAAVPAVALVVLWVAGRHALRTDWVVVALCPAATVALFVLTWMQSATVFREALRGLGERLEEKCGADRLAAWAAEEVAAHPAGAFLDPAELPDFVRDLAPGQGVRVNAQVLRQPDLYVQLYIGTGHSFLVAIHPSRTRPGATDPVSDTEWRPGIVLGTMGK
jgi:hypothetical protein